MGFSSEIYSRAQFLGRMYQNRLDPLELIATKQGRKHGERQKLMPYEILFHLISSAIEP